MSTRHTGLADTRWPRVLVLLALALPLLATAQPRGGDGQRAGDAQQRRPEVQRQPDRQQWQDSRHGHSRVYPVTGHVIGYLPNRATVVVRGNSRYWYSDGVWYAPRGGGYVVTRPAYGLLLHGLPIFATAVTFGALTYYYANNVYYRALPGERYEVVAPPEPQPEPAAAEKVFVYPRQGQSAELQASDEYECHRWASGQSGFDPTTVATGQASGAEAALRQDYQRASAACLEGRGYTVR